MHSFGKPERTDSSRTNPNVHRIRKTDMIRFSFIHAADIHLDSAAIAGENTGTFRPFVHEL